jgi:glutaredoxin-related protein
MPVKKKLKINETMIEKKELVEQLLKLKKAHQIYQLCSSEEQKEKLFKACQPLIKALVARGFEQVFVETLLIGGKDFLESLYGKRELELDTSDNARVIFGK